MTYASIMVHTEADPACEPRLRLAVGLANRFDAALVGVAAEIFEPPGLAASYADTDGTLVIAETKAVQEDLKIAESRFQGIARGVNGATEWRCNAAYPGEAVAEQARAADLIVVGPRRRQPIGFHNRLDPGDLLMRAGRPILVAPLEHEALDLSSILVAWKDTREARRAVSDALPLLAKAGAVTVAQVCRAAEETAARIQVTDVADFLARHGIKAETEVRTSSAETEAAGLVEVAGEVRAGLIVAGGFGHSRLREWVFGGVTQELLWWGGRPVLLSH